MCFDFSLTANLDGEIMGFKKELHGQKIPTPKRNIAKALGETQKAHQAEDGSRDLKRLEKVPAGSQASPFVRKALPIPEIIDIEPVISDFQEIPLANYLSLITGKNRSSIRLPRVVKTLPTYSTLEDG